MTSSHRTQISFAFTAGLALLLSVACSKNSDSSPPPPPPPPAATPVPVVTTAGAPSQTQLTDPLPDGTNPNGSNTANGGKPGAPTNSGNGQQPPPQVGNGQNSNGNRPTAMTGVEMDMDPTGQTPEQIFNASAQFGSPAPGTPAQNGLFYSSAGVDNLRDRLKALADSETSESKLNANRKLAEQIGLTTFEVDWNAHTAKLSLDLGPEGKRSNLNFTGQLDNQLRLVGGSLTGHPGVTYEATCMDDDGGCHNVQVRLRKKIGSTIAVATVISRLSSAYIYIEGDEPGVAHNQEYDNLLGLLLNTINDRGGPDSIQALAFYTSETINGSSQFAVLMRLGIQDPQRARGQAQMLGLIGPLVKPADTAMENVLLASPPTEPTVIGQRQFLLSNVIANTIRDIRMVRNDGRGNLQFDITVRKNTVQSSEDTLRLTVARIQTGTRAPTK